MAFETYLIYLAAVAVFFATPPDTSQLLIISNSVRYGLRKSVYTIAGDLSANCVQMTGANQSGQALRLYRQGFVTSMANPFTVVFFGALFPQFIDPVSPILPQLLILGATYLVVDGLILVLWGWLGVRAASALKRHSFGLVNKVCGTLMIAAAALLGRQDFQTR